MKTNFEIEVEISCIENEIVQLSKSNPALATEVWLGNMDSVIRALKWVLEAESDPIDYQSKNHSYYDRFGAPS